MYLWCVLIHSSTLNEGEGDSLQVWRVAVNITKEFSRTADKVCSSSLGVSHGADNSAP
jgi:hypothetical protein